jgi:Suppressor of forked protein (Suf)
MTFLVRSNTFGLIEHPFDRFSDARSLFERTITNYSGPRARELWTVWWKFEYYFSGVNESIELDQKLAKAYPEGEFF